MIVLFLNYNVIKFVTFLLNAEFRYINGERKSFNQCLDLSYQIDPPKLITPPFPVSLQSNRRNGAATKSFKRRAARRRTKVLDKLNKLLIYEEPDSILNKGSSNSINN